MSQHDQTSDEVFDSLTGHDEMAIVQHFDATIGSLLLMNQTMYNRALIFVVNRRNEANPMNDDEARNAALDMPMKDVLVYFPAAESEESGKDETPDEPPPTSSPDGAPEPDEVETSS